jgi:hypothetical protein
MSGAQRGVGVLRFWAASCTHISAVSAWTLTTQGLLKLGQTKASETLMFGELESAKLGSSHGLPPRRLDLLIDFPTEQACDCRSNKR